MKKNAFLLITFLGICSAFAQSPADQSAADSVIKQETANKIVKPSAKLYPNPAVNKVEVEIKGFEPGFVQLQILDHAGVAVKEEKRMVINAVEIIVLMFSLKPGLYLLDLKQAGRQARTRLVVQ